MAAAIFERDEWTCALCYGPIDRMLRHPHPLSPTLDHRTPLRRGGAHIAENVQATHLRCNSWKGNRLHVEIERVLPIWSEVSPAWQGVSEQRWSRGRSSADRRRERARAKARRA
jgi:5-methylcytosine-specific restriction endonuclease McrA